MELRDGRRHVVEKTEGAYKLCKSGRSRGGHNGIPEHMHRSMFVLVADVCAVRAGPAIP